MFSEKELACIAAGATTVVVLTAFQRGAFGGYPRHAYSAFRGAIGDDANHVSSCQAKKATTKKSADKDATEGDDGARSNPNAPPTSGVDPSLFQTNSKEMEDHLGMASKTARQNANTMIKKSLTRPAPFAPLTENTMSTNRSIGFTPPVVGRELMQEGKHPKISSMSCVSIPLTAAAERQIERQNRPPAPKEERESRFPLDEKLFNNLTDVCAK